MDETRSRELVGALRRLAASGSPAERRIASLVLSDAEAASVAPIHDLAERAGVSEPTVTRFCRAVTCDGVRDFKLRLAQICAIGGFAMFPEPVMRSSSDARIIDAVRRGAVSAIERTAASLDMGVVAQAAGAIVSARQVVALGSGGVSSIGAVELQNRLFRLSIPITAHTDGQMQRMVAAVAGETTVALALSSSGHTASVLDATRIARGYGATTIAITDPASELARTAEIVLGFTIPGDAHIVKPTSGRYALLTVIDVLATSVAETVGPNVLEGLRRIRRSLTALDMSHSGRPIGD